MTFLNNIKDYCNTVLPFYEVDKNYLLSDFLFHLSATNAQHNNTRVHLQHLKYAQKRQDMQYFGMFLSIFQLVLECKNLWTSCTFDISTIQRMQWYCINIVYKVLKTDWHQRLAINRVQTKISKYCQLVNKNTISIMKPVSLLLLNFHHEACDILNIRPSSVLL